MVRRFPGYLTNAALALVLYWIVLATVTHIPRDAVQMLPFQIWDKAAHLMAYAGLSFLLCLVFVRETRRRGLTYVAIFLLSAIYGGVDELIQEFVPGRTADVLDWLADTLGTILGIGAHLLLASWLARRSSQLDRDCETRT